MDCNHNAMASQCTGESVGPANQMFANLIQTILAVQCSLSPPDMWPKDYGEDALKQGKLQWQNIFLYNSK